MGVLKFWMRQATIPLNIVLSIRNFQQIALEVSGLLIPAGFLPKFYVEILCCCPTAGQRVELGRLLDSSKNRRTHASQRGR